MRKLITILFISVLSSSCSRVQKKHEDSKFLYNTDSTTVKFEGTITNATNECWADGMCQIEVNHSWWIVIADGLGDPSLEPIERGTALGIRFSKDNESIGKKVAVYAKIRDKSHLTLDGSNSFYIKVIEMKNLIE